MIVRACRGYVRDGKHLGGDLAYECFGPVLRGGHVNDDGNFTKDWSFPLLITLCTYNVRTRDPPELFVEKTPSVCALREHLLDISKGCNVEAFLCIITTVVLFDNGYHKSY